MKNLQFTGEWCYKLEKVEFEYLYKNSNYYQPEVS